MTREQQREAKTLKLQAQKQAKTEAKQERMESKAWDKSVEQWRVKGAWIEDNETQLTNH